MAATVVTPPPSAPATPAAPAAPAPQAPNPVTEHTHIDAVQNRIAAKLAAARPVTPMPGQPLQPPMAQTPAVASPAAPVAPAAAPNTPAIAVPAPVSDAPAVGAVPDIDLTTLDFDAPDEPAEAAELPTDGVSTPATTPESDVVKELSEVLANGAIPEKVEEVFLKTNRGRQMLTAYKSARDLAQPPQPDGKGGIGRVPTIDEIKAADTSHRVLTEIQFDADTNPLAFAHKFFTVNQETGRTFLGDPQKTVEVLQAIPQALYAAAQQTQSPVYDNMLIAYSAPLFQRFFDHQYNQALAMPEETPAQIAQYRAARQEPPLLADKIRMIDALQISEFKAFGKPRPMNWSPGQPLATTPSGPDPEKQQLLERLRAADAQIAAGRAAQLNSTVSQIESSGKIEAMADIDKAIKHIGVDKVYPAIMIDDQKDRIYGEITEALPQHDPGGWQRYQMQLQSAARGQGKPADAAKTFRQLVRNALSHSPAVRERLNNLVQGAKSHVDAQHLQRQQSQLRTDTNGAGIPAASSVIPSQQLARQPGESIEDYNTRRILAARQARAATPAR